MERRALVVGLGQRGRQWIGCLQKEPGWVLAGGVDPDQRARRDSRLPRASVFSTLDQAQDSMSDVVIVASAADTHTELCLDALDQGKAVLVEKPSALSLAGAQKIAEASDRSGLPVVVAQNYRYMRAHRTVKRVVASGALGKIGSVVAHYYRTPHEMAPSLRDSADPILWGMAVHHLDALRFVLGREARTVIAELSTQPWTELEQGATMRALVDFEDDVRLTYTATYESRGHEYFGGGQEFYERIVGDRATLHVFHRWLFLCEGRRLPRPVRRGKRSSTEESVLLKQLAQALDAGDEPECSIQDNLRTVALLEACLESARLRRWVDVEPS